MNQTESTVSRHVPVSFKPTFRLLFYSPTVTEANYARSIGKPIMRSLSFVPMSSDAWAWGMKNLTDVSAHEKTVADLEQGHFIIRAERDYSKSFDEIKRRIEDAGGRIDPSRR